MDPLEVSLCFLGKAAAEGTDDVDLGLFAAPEGGSGGGGAIGLLPSLWWSEGRTGGPSLSWTLTLLLLRTAPADGAG